MYTLGRELKMLQSRTGKFSIIKIYIEIRLYFFSYVWMCAGTYEYCRRM